MVIVDAGGRRRSHQPSTIDQKTPASTSNVSPPDSPNQNQPGLRPHLTKLPPGVQQPGQSLIRNEPARERHDLPIRGKSQGAAERATLPGRDWPEAFRVDRVGDDFDS